MCDARILLVRNDWWVGAACDTASHIVRPVSASRGFVIADARSAKSVANDKRVDGRQKISFAPLGHFSQIRSDAAVQRSTHFGYKQMCDDGAVDQILGNFAPCTRKVSADSPMAFQKNVADCNRSRAHAPSLYFIVPRANC